MPDRETILLGFLKILEVAEIDSEGVVRAMGIGEAEIICSLREIPLTSDGHDGSIFHYVTCKIKVDSVGTNTEFEDFKWELTDINNKGEYCEGWRIS